MPKSKSIKVQAVIEQAVEILEAVGVKTDDLTKRRKEKMAMSFLSLAKVTVEAGWRDAESVKTKHVLRTREIIEFINEHFEENISASSYDDIRRKDLIRLVGMGLVIKSANNPGADTNDGTRGYALSASFAELIRSFGGIHWKKMLANFDVDLDYSEKLEGKRVVPKLKVVLEPDLSITLDDGPHNRIQKAVVEEFLPRYGFESTVIYIGDTSEKQIVKYNEKMIALGLDVKDRGMLPDIVAYSPVKDWIYLIEAVHSSNPLNPERCIELQRSILKDCNKGIVFVTAFLTRADFKKWVSELAWETEVWLADTPDHMIHFNGDKFLGPYAEG